MNSRKAHTMMLIPLAAAVLLAAAPVMAAGGPPSLFAQAAERPSLSANERENLAMRARAAVHAGIPEEEVEIIIGRGLDRGVDAAILGSFLETAVQTKEQGLPVRPILDRIEQGLSKNVAPSRINEASRRLAAGLAQARPLVDGLLQRGMAPGATGARDAALENVARAGEQSIPIDALRSVGEKVASQGQTLSQFERAVRTLTFLTGAGMPPDASLHMIEACVEHGFSERDFARLERNVNDMVRRGHSMEDIVGATEREVREHRGSPAGSRGMMDRGPDTGRDGGGRGGRGR